MFLPDHSAPARAATSYLFRNSLACIHQPTPNHKLQASLASQSSACVPHPARRHSGAMANLLLPSPALPLENTSSAASSLHKHKEMLEINSINGQLPAHYTKEQKRLVCSALYQQTRTFSSLPEPDLHTLCTTEPSLTFPYSQASHRRHGRVRQRSRARGR